MAKVPARVETRIVNALKKYQPILEDARKRDVNESDTVTIVTDLLHDVFGYEKYTEITSEHAIKGTYVDLAIKTEGNLQLLIEVKSIGTTLDDRHVRQAVDYAANQGVDWVVLTNGVEWHVYKVLFAKPIHQELVMKINLLQVNQRNRSDLEMLWPLCRRGMLKSVLEEYHAQRQATNKYMLGAILLTDPVIRAVRTEVRRVSEGLLVDPDELRALLTAEVLKREVVEGEKAIEAVKKVRKGQKRALRARKTLTPNGPDEAPGVEAEVVDEEIPDPDAV